MKDTSKATKKSREKQGVTPTSFAFTVDEKLLVDAWAKETGLSRKDAILEAIRSAQRQGDLSNTQLLALLKARLGREK
jgi:hypothetical protein